MAVVLEIRSSRKVITQRKIGIEGGKRKILDMVIHTADGKSIVYNLIFESGLSKVSNPEGKIEIYLATPVLHENIKTEPIISPYKVLLNSITYEIPDPKSIEIDVTSSDTHEFLRERMEKEKLKSVKIIIKDQLLSIEWGEFHARKDW